MIEAGYKFWNITELVGVDIDIFVNCAFFGVDLFLCLVCGIEKSEGSTQLTNSSNNNQGRFQYRPTHSLDKMCELEIADLIKGNFLLCRVLWNGENINIVLDSDGNIVIYVNTDWPYGPIISGLSEGNVVWPGLTNSVIDNFISEDTAFFCANDQ